MSVNDWINNHAAAVGGKVFQPPSQNPSFFLDDNDDEDDDEDNDEETEEEQANELDDDEDRDEPEDDDDEENDNEGPPPRKRPKPFSSSSSSQAFLYLQGQATPAQSDLSEPARHLLHGLLQEHQLLGKSFLSSSAHASTTTNTQHHHENGNDNDDDFDKDRRASAVLSVASQQTALELPLRVVDSSSISDFAIVSLTKHAKNAADQWSYLAGFLRVLDQQQQTDTTTTATSTGVSAKVLIKQCCLAIAPQHVPAGLDAEEMAMAALEFLSSSSSSSSTVNLEDTFFPQLPLICPVKHDNDIRRRFYVKAFPWTWTELSSNPTWIRQLRALDDMFWNDASSYKWLRRGAFVPPSLGVTPNNNSNSAAMVVANRSNHNNNDYSDDPQDVQSAMEANNELDALLRKGKHKAVATAPKKKAAPAAAANKA